MLVTNLDSIDIQSERIRHQQTNSQTTINEQEEQKTITKKT